MLSFVGNRPLSGKLGNAGKLWLAYSRLLHQPSWQASTPNPEPQTRITSSAADSSMSILKTDLSMPTAPVYDQAHGCVLCSQRNKEINRLRRENEEIKSALNKLLSIATNHNNCLEQLHRQILEVLGRDAPTSI
jgi:hypothetical protein